MGLDMDFSKLQPQDVLDLAAFAEEEAFEQYQYFASTMEAHGNHDASAFFLKMADREQLHRRQIAERRNALYPDAPANLANRAIWGVEAPYQELAAETMTVADAFRIAMSAEKRAEDYYAAALLYVTQPQVTELFEGLRQAEIEHQRLLTRETARYSS